MGERLKWMDTRANHSNQYILNSKRLHHVLMTAESLLFPQSCAGSDLRGRSASRRRSFINLAELIEDVHVGSWAMTLIRPRKLHI